MGRAWDLVGRSSLVVQRRAGMRGRRPESCRLLDVCRWLEAILCVGGEEGWLWCGLLHAVPLHASKRLRHRGHVVRSWRYTGGTQPEAFHVVTLPLLTGGLHPLPEYFFRRQQALGRRAWSDW